MAEPRTFLVRDKETGKTFRIREKTQDSSNPMSEAMTMASSGMTGAGVGLKKADAPGITMDAINGMLGGVPRAIDRYPAQTAIAGLPGAGVASGTEQRDFAPAGIMSAVASLTNALKGGKTSAPTFTPDTEELPKPQTLSGQVVGKIGEAIAPIAATGLASKSKFLTELPKVTESKPSVFNAGSKLKEVESKLAEFPKKTLSYQNEIRDTRFHSSNDLAKLSEEFKIKNQALGKALQNESYIQVKENKDSLKGLFKSMSKTYRKGLDSAEDALAQRGDVIDSQEYLKVIDKTVDDLVKNNLPEDNSSFQSLRKLQRSLQTGERNTGILDASGKEIILPEPSKPINLTDLKNLKNQVYDTLSSGFKSGTQYADEGDYIAGQFLRNHGQYIGMKSPELANLNKEFAPMADARRWAMKTFKPYTESEIQRGANVLQKLAAGKQPSQTDLNYLKTLEEGVGKFKGAGSLRGKTSAIGSDISATKNKFEAAKKALIDATDFRINKLQNELADIKSDNINLGFKRDKLKDLVKTRNILIGLGASAIASPFIKKALTAGSQISSLQ